ncbi:hypothetical protein BXZ70DRAFT_532902 [Cristinia sonorae]|uniref:MI domain-containing protein n=1 Tax=Cristinia sonorae TaxID=1940300 RepID=A0A8K0UIE1_9AGAR|nr:hypothetical protein BXZ70DRAFT_532902 [Cristinia sonorae]
MDVYFQRMKELTKSANVNSRMQFMLQDVIELRERKWIPRNQVATPTTMASIHEANPKHTSQSSFILLIPEDSEEKVLQTISEDSEDFFCIRDLDQADVYFTHLPVQHRHRLVEKLISMAIRESKATDAELVANFFARAASKNDCSPSTFERGFAPMCESLDDIVYDSPRAFSLYATMMKGAGLDKDEARRARLASKLADGGKLLRLLL